MSGSSDSQEEEDRSLSRAFSNLQCIDELELLRTQGPSAPGLRHLRIVVNNDSGCSSETDSDYDDWLKIATEQEKLENQNLNDKTKDLKRDGKDPEDPKDRDGGSDSAASSASST